MEEPSLGKRLLAGREAKGLTSSAVAATTRIPLTSIEALEADALSDLPADVYVRGFVRAYCRAVDLPEGPPLEALERALGTRRTSSGLPGEDGRPLTPLTPLGALGTRRVKVVGIAGALVVVGVVIWLVV